MDLWEELYLHCKFNVLSRKVYINFLSKLFATTSSKKVKRFPGDKLTTLPVQGTSGISTVKEHTHNANEHLKIIR